MIFGNVYDRTLWLLLKIDKNNQEEIIKFIKEIPTELLIEIQNLVATIDYNTIFSKKKSEGVRFGPQQLYSYDGELITDYGIVYEYEIDQDWLDITKFENDEEIFALTLCPFPPKSFVGGLIGSITHNQDLNKHTDEFEEIDYYSFKTPAGYFVTFEADCEDKRYFKYVSPLKMPSDLKIDEINEISQQKTLKKIKRHPYI